MKLTLHFRKVILPKEYVVQALATPQKNLTLLNQAYYHFEFQLLS
jgi:hypothetical protein